MGAITGGITEQDTYLERKQADRVYQGLLSPYASSAGRYNYAVLGNLFANPYGVWVKRVCTNVYDTGNAFQVWVARSSLFASYFHDGAVYGEFPYNNAYSSAPVPAWSLDQNQPATSLGPNESYNLSTAQLWTGTIGSAYPSYTNSTPAFALLTPAMPTYEFTTPLYMAPGMSLAMISTAANEPIGMTFEWFEAPLVNFLTYEI